MNVQMVIEKDLQIIKMEEHIDIIMVQFLNSILILKCLMDEF